MKKITLTVGPSVPKSALIKILKRSFSDISLGSTLQSMALREPVIEVDVDCPECEERLEKILNVVDHLESAKLPYSLLMHRVAAKPIGGGKPLPEIQEISRTVIERELDRERSENRRGISEAALQLISALRRATWFSRVGEPEAEANISQVYTSEEAYLASRTRRWFNIRIEAQNRLTEQLCYEFPERYHRRWNRLANELLREINPLVSSKCQASERLGNVPDDVRETLQSIAFLGCMEQQYSDCIPPAYGTSWTQWIIAGHLPCGWMGEFPSDAGSLIIF